MTVAELQDKANEIREDIIKMLLAAGSGHSAGPLGSADFWTALYFGEVLNVNPSEPWRAERDRVVLSAGHYAPVLYATLANAGFFPKEELDSLRQLGSRLQGHPHFEVGNAKQLPGIETSSGPLGQGISQAVGMAMAGRLDKQRWRVVCFMGDGEQNEGEVWEAYMLAGKEKLGNLTLVIDRNNIQIDGHTEEVMPLEPLKEKLMAFNLDVIEVNGHDIGEIIKALATAKMNTGKTSVILMRTIPGKGVSFMENKPYWHGNVPKGDEGITALRDIEKIRTLGGKIISEHQ